MADYQDVPMPPHAWIVVYQPDGPGTRMETLLAGPPGTGWPEFALVIADTIRHVARAHHVDPGVVNVWVQKELSSPTTTISGGKPQ